MLNEDETLQELFRQCEDKIWTDYGLSLRDVRDLHTGCVIGTTHNHIWFTALRDEGVLDDSEDGSVIEIEELADSLLVRSLASARPSPALNRPTTRSLLRLLESDPLTVNAYLLNRYHLTHWRKLSHRDDSWFEDMLHRVKVWEKLERLTSDADTDAVERSLRALAHWLLELDSKCNLHELTPPDTFFADFHALDNVDAFERFITDFEQHAIPILVEADRLFKIGNRMASSAYTKSWFDNPTLAERKVEIANKKRQGLYDKYGSVAVGMAIEADKSAKKKAKAIDTRIIKGRSSRSKAAKLVNKHAATLDALFRSLGEAIGEPAPAPTPKPAKPNGLPKLVKG